MAFINYAHIDSLLCCSKVIPQSEEVSCMTMSQLDWEKGIFCSLFSYFDYSARGLIVLAKPQITNKTPANHYSSDFCQSSLFPVFPFSWTPAVSAPASPPGHLPLLLSLVKNGILHVQWTVATQELLLAEAIPAGFHLSTSESSTVEMHLGNVLNGRIWRHRGGRGCKIRRIS